MSHLVMNSNPRVPGGRPLMAIGYKYRYQKILGFIDMEGGGSTVPGIPYLSNCPDDSYNVSICPVIFSHFIGRYFSACNSIDN